MEAEQRLIGRRVLREPPEILEKTGQVCYPLAVARSSDEPSKLRVGSFVKSDLICTQAKPQDQRRSGGLGGGERTFGKDLKSPERFEEILRVLGRSGGDFQFSSQLGSRSQSTSVWWLLGNTLMSG